MAEVVIRKVKKIYQSTHKKKQEDVLAVKDLNLTIRDGEFLALLGPSGCGKTTTLRMIVGLESITEGEILIGGNIVNDWNPAQRNVAMAFETYALYTHLTVRGNLGLCLKAKSLPTQEIDKQVNRVAEILKISLVERHRRIFPEPCPLLAGVDGIGRERHCGARVHDSMRGLSVGANRVGAFCLEDRMAPCAGRARPAPPRS